MCSRPAKSRTRYGCCPISLRLDVGRLLGGLYGLISGVTWLIGPFGYTGLRHLFAQRKRTGPAHEQQCSAIIVPFRCFHPRSSWWENALDSCGGRRCRHSHHDRANASASGVLCYWRQRRCRSHHSNTPQPPHIVFTHRHPYAGHFWVGTCASGRRDPSDESHVYYLLVGAISSRSRAAWTVVTKTVGREPVLQVC